MPCPLTMLSPRIWERSGSTQQPVPTILAYQLAHIEPETHHSIGSSGLPLVTLLWAEIKWTWHEFLPPSHEAHCTLAESPWLALGDWQGAGINVTAR